jgi:CRP-like cAMP-binding protein
METDEELIATYGPHPVSVNTLYDGQSFGGLRRAGGKHIRIATVSAHEDVMLLRYRPADFQKIIAAVREENEDDSGRLRRCDTGLDESLQSRQRGLQLVPFLSECTPQHLMQLARNVKELDLRYGDELLQVGAVPSACFIICEGFCKLCVPAESPKEKSNTITVVDADQTEATENAEGNLPSVPQETVTQPCGSGVAAARCGSSYATREGSTPVPTRPATPRKPGASRPRTSWATSLRNGPIPYWTGGPTPKEIELGYLYPGEAFGLGTLLDARGEFHYSSAVTVRIDSNLARILVLTARSMVYLSDKVQSGALKKIREMTDPVNIPDQDIQKERSRRCHWASVKGKVLRQEMTTI